MPIGQGWLAADVIGDLANTVGREHTSASVNGQPGVYALRVTQVYRREEGGWKLAHRRADTLEQAESTRGA